LRYRPEIDGLRAIALISVVLFHAGFGTFSGGFIGVDIFFVISGYLITLIILTEKKSGKFSLKIFYERRARRILPALIFIIILCIPTAYFFLLPKDFRNFSQSLVSISFFSSNILFWQESNYFDIASELKPLLHTWSLSIEAQFYIIFSLLILFIWRLKKIYILSILILLAITSLLLSQLGSYYEPKANFFLLPTRWWELSFGIFIAFYLFRKKKITSHIKNEFLGILGLALILYSIFTYSKNTPTPSIYTLVPIIGTSLIILFSNPKTIVGKILSNKFLVSIGLISYSAYLWHYPIFVFARHMNFEDLTILEYTLLTLISLILAYFSFKFIETPFRKKNFITQKKVFIFSIIFSVFTFLIGFMGHYKIINKQDIIFGWLNKKNVPEIFKGIKLNGTNCSSRDPLNACLLGDLNAPLRIVISGDSHARALTEIANIESYNYNYNLIDLTASGCPFLINLNLYINNVEHKNCNKKYQEKRMDLLKKIKPSIVILHSRFAHYTGRGGFNNSIGGVEFSDYYYMARKKGETLEERDKHFLKSFEETVHEIKKAGHKVIIIGNIPPTGWDPIYRLYRIENFKIGKTFKERLDLMNVPIDAVNNYHKLTDDFIKLIIKKNKDVIFLDPKSLFCKKHICFSITNNSILYSDNNHLSTEGEKMLFEEILNLISIKPKK